MKKSELFFTTILVPLDFLMLFLAGLSSYFIRTHPLIAEYRPVLFSLNLPLNKYLGLVVAVSLYFLVVFALVGLYRIKTRRMILDDFLKIVIGVSAGIFILVLYIFMSRESFDSRFLILASWVFAVLYVLIGRFFIIHLQKFLIKKYHFSVNRILIIGKDNISEKIIRNIKEEPSLGYFFAGNLDSPDLKKIKERIINSEIDEIILTSLDWPKEKIIKLTNFCEENHIVFKFVPNIFQTLTVNSSAITLGEIPLIVIKRTVLDGWGRVIKRIFDIIFSSLFIIIFSPLYILLAILIKIDSSGSVIYKDYRYGYKRKKFKFYKFRSMEIDLCDGEFGTKEGNKMLRELENNQDKNIRNNSPLHKIKDDPRVTKLGKFIRKYSLDELPQFFNVLKGDMSIVGYRPHMSYEVEKYNFEQKKMFCSKPGITGLAQVSGRSDLEFDEEVKLDLFYIENWSIKLDLIILLKTPFVILFKKHK